MSGYFFRIHGPDCPGSSQGRSYLQPLNWSPIRRSEALFYSRAPMGNATGERTKRFENPCQSGQHWAGEKEDESADA